MSNPLDSLLTEQQRAQAAAWDAYQAARASHPRLPVVRDFFNAAADTYNARKLGAVAPHRLPCPSDADPSAHDADDTRTDMLVCIEEAIGKLEQARILLEQGKPSCELAARSLMNEAIDWASESEA